MINLTSPPMIPSSTKKTDCSKPLKFPTDITSEMILNLDSQKAIMKIAARYYLIVVVSRSAA